MFSFLCVLLIILAIQECHDEAMNNEAKYRKKELAELLHISQATYSRYESGELDIPHSALQILADFYDTSVDYLLGRTDVKKAYPRKK